jgi:hypothetical protein
MDVPLVKWLSSAENSSKSDWSVLDLMFMYNDGSDSDKYRPVRLFGVLFPSFFFQDQLVQSTLDKHF